jgi:hypothetical protein
VAGDTAPIGVDSRVGHQRCRPNASSRCRHPGLGGADHVLIACARGLIHPRESQSSVGAASSVDRWRQVAERAVPASVVVVVLPGPDHDPGVGQAPEDIDVQAFVADPGVE